MGKKNKNYREGMTATELNGNKIEAETATNDVPSASEEVEVAAEKEAEKLVWAKVLKYSNLRNKPSMESDIVDKIPAGTEVQILEFPPRDGFYKVAYRYEDHEIGHMGYIKEELIELL